MHRDGAQRPMAPRIIFPSLRYGNNVSRPPPAFYPPPAGLAVAVPVLVIQGYRTIDGTASRPIASLAISRDSPTDIAGTAGGTRWEDESSRGRILRGLCANGPRRCSAGSVRSIVRSVQAKVRVLLMLPDRVRGITESVWRMVICVTAMLPVRNCARVSTPARALRSKG